jgi:rhamnogalacturonyl hydrolase YesR
MEKKMKMYKIFNNGMRFLKLKFDIEVKKFRLKNFYCEEHSNINHLIHLDEAAAWLCRAQDSGDDDGVSYGIFLGEDFLPSYPETTGYIIRTFLKLSEYYNNEEYLIRAIKMGDWEIAIQMDSGAVVGGLVNSDPTPAVFNTGQVLLGWNALYMRTSEKRFYNAAEKAAEWLLKTQEDDGNWIKGNSIYSSADFTIYNVRAAWALCQFAILSGEDKYKEASINNANYTLNHQTKNGWFHNCCLTDPNHPLLHTIAYTMRGLLEIGVLCKVDSFIDSVITTARSLMLLIRENGFIPGRINSKFQPAANYACLTGMSQVSIVWAKLFRITQEKEFKQSVSKVNEYLMRHHDISSIKDTVRGGVTGSWPVHGAYGRFMILNWATKFFIDALLEEIELKDSGNEMEFDI